MTKKEAIFLLLGAAASTLLWSVSDLSFDRPRSGAIMPEVVFAASDELQLGACRDDAVCFSAKALYEPAKHRIYLRRDWSARNFHDLGILFHEFVHHLQAIGKLSYPCRGAEELPAYELQEAFYRAHKRDPEGYVPSAFTRFTRFSCAVEE